MDTKILEGIKHDLEESKLIENATGLINHDLENTEYLYHEVIRLLQENEQLKQANKNTYETAQEMLYELSKEKQNLIKYLGDKIRNTKDLNFNKRWSQGEIAYFNHHKDFALRVYTDLLERVKSGKYE